MSPLKDAFDMQRSQFRTLPLPSALQILESGTKQLETTPSSPNSLELLKLANPKQFTQPALPFQKNH